MKKGEKCSLRLWQNQQGILVHKGRDSREFFNFFFCVRHWWLIVEARVCHRTLPALPTLSTLKCKAGGWCTATLRWHPNLYLVVNLREKDRIWEKGEQKKNCRHDNSTPCLLLGCAGVPWLDQLRWRISGTFSSFSSSHWNLLIRLMLYFSDYSSFHFRYCLTLASSAGWPAMLLTFACRRYMREGLQHHPPIPMLEAFYFETENFNYAWNGYLV